MFEESDVKNFLAHYSSEFYDPAKAHAYYEEHKKLKGGYIQPAAKETAQQRHARVVSQQTRQAALSYSTNQINIKRKAEVAKAQAAQKAHLAAMHKNLESRRAQIQQQLKQALDKLKADAAASAVPVKLNPIPANAAPKVKAFLEQQNAKILASAKQDAAVANKKVAVATSASKKAASAQLHKLGNDMQAAIAKARSDYTQARHQTAAKYKAVKANEQKNIKAQVH